MTFRTTTTGTPPFSVPEPPTFTLFVLGFAGMVLWRHSKSLFQKKRLAICLLLVLPPSVVKAVSLSDLVTGDTYRKVELEVAGIKWGHLLLDSTAGTIVDSDLQMPGNYGTPESPNGWNNFTHVSGPLSWQTVGNDLARIQLPERIVTTLSLGPAPWGEGEMMWFTSTSKYKLITEIQFQPSTLIGLDRDTFMSEKVYPAVDDSFVRQWDGTFSQSGTKRWYYNYNSNYWDDDGGDRFGTPQDVWVRVPEPSSFALGAFGVVSLIYLGWRRRFKFDL